jgi:hypothetical protein
MLARNLIPGLPPIGPLDLIQGGAQAAEIAVGLPQSTVINDFGANADWVNRLHTLCSRLARHSVDAQGVNQAVNAVLAQLGPKERIPSLQFWGHGRPGGMEVGNEFITAASFQPGHPQYRALCRLRAQLGPNATVYFRGCETFRGAEGRAFAEAAARFFNCRVVGYTRVIPPWTSQQELRPGQRASWKD